MPDENVFKLKTELRKMRKRDLLKMVLNQKEKNCLLGGACPFSFGVQTHSFLCLRNPGPRVPDRKAKVRFPSRSPK
jgi:hypothetical protein